MEVPIWTPKLGLSFTMERAHDPNIWNKVTIANGFTTCGVRFKPAFHHHLGRSYQILRLIHLWGLSPHPCYGTWMTCIESSKDPIDIWGQLAPLNWMISSKNLTIVMICNKCEIINLHLSWHRKVYSNIFLWEIITSYTCLWGSNWRMVLNWLANYMFIT